MTIDSPRTHFLRIDTLVDVLTRALNQKSTICLRDAAISYRCHNLSEFLRLQNPLSDQSNSIGRDDLSWKWAASAFPKHAWCTREEKLSPRSKARLEMMAELSWLHKLLISKPSIVPIVNFHPPLQGLQNDVDVMMHPLQKCKMHHGIREQSSIVESVAFFHDFLQHSEGHLGWNGRLGINEGVAKISKIRLKTK